MFVRLVTDTQIKNERSILISQINFFVDLDCGWCPTDNVCYGRTFGANCTANLQTTWCPGICPALHDCHACLIHGNERSSPDVGVRSFATKFGLNQCQWCVQNARCNHKDNYGTCGSGDDTPSQEMGMHLIICNSKASILNVTNVTNVNHPNRLVGCEWR